MQEILIVAEYVEGLQKLSGRSEKFLHALGKLVGGDYRALTDFQRMFMSALK